MTNAAPAKSPAQSHSFRSSGMLTALVWALAVLFVFYQLYPLLRGVEPAGWDITGHLYVFNEFLSNLAHGRVHGYDFMWGGGYPTFTLYPPSAYLFLALPFLVTGGAISPLASFDIGIVLSV